MRLVPPGFVVVLLCCLAQWVVSADLGVIYSDVQSADGFTKTVSVKAGQTSYLNDAQYEVCQFHGAIFDMAGNTIPRATLKFCEGDKCFTKYTDDQGTYSLVLPYGEYHFNIIAPAEYSCDPSSRCKSNTVVSIPSCLVDPIPACAQGVFYLSSTVKGITYEDQDKNRIKSSTEIPVPGILVTLFPTKQTRTTNSNGYYEFRNLKPGPAFAVEFTVPSGSSYKFVENGGEKVNIGRLLPGEERNVDKGLYLLASIEGLVWNDADADGVYQRGEEILSNVPVNLFNAEGRIVHTGMSDDEGYYLFTDLEPGNYYVEFGTANGFKHSKVAHTNIL